MAKIVKNKNTKVNKTTTIIRRNSKRKVVIVGTTAAILAGSGFVAISPQSDIAVIKRDFTPEYAIIAEDLDVAKADLQNLAVRNEVENLPKYDDKDFASWMNIDDDKCDTRIDILERDLIIGKVDKKACKVLEGKIFDYYSGEELVYDIEKNGGGIDIDHIVAKGNAWISGGYKWDAEKWKNYANDPDLLLAVSASLNRSKADDDAAEWLPPNEDYRCRYVVTQVRIKDKYALSVSENEKAKMAEVLENSCKAK